MKKLLIASIYTPISRDNGWYDIQRRFFDLTTKDYDFGVFCNSVVDHVDPKDFPGAVILGQQDHEDLNKHFANNDYQPDDEPEFTKNNATYLYDMRVAYFKIMDYFREHADEYENFLMLDCDAFPVHPHWQVALTRRMEMTKRWYAALLRAEHFETYPWLGVFYIRGKYIHEDIPDWFPRNYENAWGHTYREFGTVRNKTHHDGEQIWYPMLRSNVLNLHPLRFGVYNHFFYHHMRGSWNKDDGNFKSELTALSRAELYGYYDHYMHRDSHKAISEHCHKRLLNDPEGFIASLMGVKPDDWFNQEMIEVENDSVV